nr:serine hydrolase [uncultured Arsenicibacter sp.]
MMKYLLMQVIALMLLLLWLIPYGFGQPTPVLQRIRHVEAGLVPSVELVGEPVQRYTLADRMRYYHVPAVSIAVINNGQLEWAKAYGHLSADSLQPATPETLFQAASVSKPVSALGVLRLVEQERIRLDSNVNTYLSGWKVPSSRFTAQKPVTLRQLLSHSSGLNVHGFGGYLPGKPLPTVRQILNGEAPANSPAVRSDTVPGARWRYSGGGYMVIQQLTEDITRQPFAAYMQQAVLKPLGMRHSTFAQPLPANLLAKATTGHDGKGAKINGDRHIYPELAPAGLWTTPTDLAAYLLNVQQAFRNKQGGLLSQAMTRQMLTPQSGGYGLGPGLGGQDDKLAFGHGGGNEGFRCFIYAFAHTGQGAVVMTNADNGMDLVYEVLRGISAEYNWPAFKPVTKKVVPLPANQLTRLAGRYEGYGDKKPELHITVSGNGLLVTQVWNGDSYTLLPEGGLAFFTLDGGSPFVFETSPDGNITGLLAFGSDRWTRTGN